MERPPSAPPEMDMAMPDAPNMRTPSPFHYSPPSSSSAFPPLPPDRCLLLVVSSERRVSYANAAAKARLRIQPGDAIDSVRRCLTLNELLAAYERMCADPQARIEPFAVRHHDGSVYTCTLEPILDDKTFTGVAVYLHPRCMSLALCNDVDTLSTFVLDALRSPILAVDNSNRILHLNLAARRHLGFSLAEVRGLDASKVIECNQEEIARHLRGPAGEWSGQVAVRTRSSLQLQQCMMHATVLRSAEGEAIGSVRTFDVAGGGSTQPSAYEPRCVKRLRSSSVEEQVGSVASSIGSSPVPNRLSEDVSLLQAVREQVVSATVIVSPEGLVEWATDSKWLSAIMNGLTATEAHGNPAAAILCGQPVDFSVVAGVRDALAKHQPLDIIIPQVPRETTSTRNLHLHIEPVFNADGTIRHTVAKLRDIDLDRQASEEALASKLRLEFFNTLSHELKTPLNGIIGASTVVLKTLQINNASSELRTNMETILSCAEVLSTLINNLIDYRKIEANKLELQRVPLDVRATFRGAVQQCEAIAHQKSMTLNIVLPSSLPTYVACDPLRLTQVTVNLVLNAIKYSPPGRPVNVAVSAVIPPDRTDVCRLTVSVEDHGIGISDEKLARIFNPSADTPPESGAGLGLRICKKLVERMNGSIAVESKLGVGTKFTYTVEAGMVSDAQAHFLARERALTPNPNFSILIVEDNILNQKVLLRILQQLGYNADVAADGRQAIEMAAKHNYDLILMDIAMPVMNGLDATRYIFRNWDEEHRPVIVGVTANAVTKELNEYIQAGMADCVTKPVTMAKVLAILQSAREADAKRQREIRRGSC